MCWGRRSRFLSRRRAEIIRRLSPSAQKVQDTLRELGFTHQVVEVPQTTRTAAEAAQAIGCRVEQVVKSLVFGGKRTYKPVLVIASGGNRVNERRLGELFGEPIERPDPEYVRQQTGFAIGGVPPIGHARKLAVFMDEDLLRYEEVWAAAGTPYAVFRLTPEELVQMTEGQVVSVK